MTKKMNYSKDFLEKIKKELLEEKTRVEADLGKFTHKNPHAKGDYETNFEEYGDEEDDNVKEIEQYTVNKPLEINLETLLRDINKSLDRIEKGTYGICRYCKKQIPEKRLLARPTSSSCIDCKKTLTDEV